MVVLTQTPHLVDYCIPPAVSWMQPEKKGMNICFPLRTSEVSTAVGYFSEMIILSASVNRRHTDLKRFLKAEDTTENIIATTCVDPADILINGGRWYSWDWDLIQTYHLVGFSCQKAQICAFQTEKDFKEKGFIAQYIRRGVLDWPTDLHLPSVQIKFIPLSKRHMIAFGIKVNKPSLESWRQFQS